MSSLSDQLGFNFRGPERRVWKVRDLVAAVRTHVEREYSDAWVEGEISNFRAPESGHLYFTLKDGNAQIRVVMFRSSARLLRFRPADGLQVVVRGRVTVYEDRGELQISAEYIEPKGAGSLQLAFEQLKAKLEAEGLFAAERKKPIPPLPSRIGIVTSANAAALGDIDVPTLITFGARDLVCSTRFAEPLKSGIAGSELVVFEHLSHAGLHEDPETFNRATLDFLLSQRS